MVQLHQDYKKFQRKDTEIVVIGPEDSESFAKYWDKEELEFIGLPDKEHSVLKQYGQEVNLFKLGRMPAQMLIDKKGVLRYIHYGHSMSDIPSNEEILSLINTVKQNELLK